MKYIVQEYELVLLLKRLFHQVFIINMTEIYVKRYREKNPLSDYASKDSFNKGMERLGRVS